MVRLVALSALLVGSLSPAAGVCVPTTIDVIRYVYEPYSETTVTLVPTPVTRTAKIGTRKETKTDTIERTRWGRIRYTPVYRDVPITREYVYAHTNWYVDDWGDWLPLTCGGYWPWDEATQSWVYGEPYCGGHTWAYAYGHWYEWSSHQDWSAFETIGVRQEFVGNAIAGVDWFDAPPGVAETYTETVTTTVDVPVFGEVTETIYVPVPSVESGTRLRKIVEQVTVDNCVRPS